MSAIADMDLKRVVAINLRRERHAREFTQEELADRAGLTALTNLLPRPKS
jgi:hypothetical protein